MPIKDKDLSKEQKLHNAEEKHLRENYYGKFIQHHANSESDIVHKGSFEERSELGKKKEKDKLDKNHKEVIVNNMSRLQTSRTNFQAMVEAARKVQQDQLAK